MAAITDPEALAFVNQRVRPNAERIRALVTLITDMETDWFNGTNTAFSEGTDTVEDRLAEGLPALTAAEITNFVTAAIAIRDQITPVAGRTALVEKACVRPLDIS